MAYSTIHVGLLGVVLASGCGGEDCETRVLDPCPDCGSGDVLRGALGDTFVAPRPDGGYIAVSCDADLVWRDRELRVEDRVAASVYRPVGRPTVAAVGEVAVVIPADDDDDPWLHLAAIARDGEMLWRTTMGSILLDGVTAAGDALFVAGALQGTTFFGEDVELGWKVARVDPADGSLLWTWAPPMWAVPASFAPLASGGGLVVGSFTRSVDFGGAAGLLDAGDGTAGFIVALGSDGVPVWARAVTGDYVTTIDAVATSASGDIAIAGEGAGEIDLGGGTVVPAPGFFGALLGPDGTARWGAGFGSGDEDQLRVIAAGGAVLVAGRLLNGNLSDDMFVYALREEGVVWERVAISPHNDTFYDIARTADDTALVAVDIGTATDVDEDVTMTFGRIELAGETSAVLEVRP